MTFIERKSSTRAMRKDLPRPARNDASQGGFALLTFAGLLVVLVAFGALALDLGILYSQRTAAQRAADSAALAGAFTFIVDPQSPQPATAIQHAIATATNNSITGVAVNPSEVTVNVDTANRRVTVGIQRTEGTFFAKAMGTTKAAIHVSGVAEAATTPTGAFCTKPWFVPNTILSPQQPCTACQSGNQLLVKNGKITPYAQSFIDSNNNLITIKPQSPSNALGPGQFYPFQLTGAQGASVYRRNIETCAPLAVSCGTSYIFATGNMNGPTQAGTNNLIGSPPDTYQGVGQYQRADGTVSDTSRSLVLVPVWDDCNTPSFCPTNKLQGNNNSATVIAFALVFITGVPGGNVQARLINIVRCSGSGGGGGTPAPFALPVRLVRTN